MENESSTSKTFILAQDVCFLFNRSVCSSQMVVSENGRKAEKRDPAAFYAYGVTYSSRPLQGTVEFEVEIVSYGTGWSGTLKLGVMRCKAGQMPKEIPRYSPEGAEHCVWSADKVYNRLSVTSKGEGGSLERNYGKVNLDDLREGDRLGFRLTSDGVLVFFVNGKYQGVAADSIYQKGWDVYTVVDHYANCRSTSITRAVMQADLNLQRRCTELLALWLKTERAVENLPLPVRLKEQIQQLCTQP